MVEVPAHLYITPGQCRIDEYFWRITNHSDVSTLAGLYEFLRQSVVVFCFTCDRVLAEFYLFWVPAHDTNLLKIESGSVLYF